MRMHGAEAWGRNMIEVGRPADRVQETHVGHGSGNFGWTDGRPSRAPSDLANYGLCLALPGDEFVLSPSLPA